jgi:hypothetical protein
MSRSNLKYAKLNMVLFSSIALDLACKVSSIID